MGCCFGFRVFKTDFERSCTVLLLLEEIHWGEPGSRPPLKTLMHVYIGQLKRRVLIECPLLNSVRTTDRTACRQ